MIPLLSFTGFGGGYVSSGFLFSGGWWARNFRTSARRMMLVESTTVENRSRAFGILHGLDAAGGIIAAVILITLFSLGFQFRLIFLLSILPLFVSTLLLAITRKTVREKICESNVESKPLRRTYLGILVATALFGFSYYSIGFPILTAVQRSSSISLGLMVFPIFLTASSVGGFLFGKFAVKKEILWLGMAGYILAGLGTFGIFVVLAFNSPLPLYYVAIIILGLGTSAIETFEPSIVSKIIKGRKAGTGMGILSSFRSIGMFTGNIVMGILYSFSAEYSYIYATLVAVVGGIIVLYFGSGFATQVIRNSA